MCLDRWGILEPSGVLCGGLPTRRCGGVGLGRHEDSECPVEDPPFGVCFEDVDGGSLGGGVQGDAMASSILEGWRCGLALRLRR